MANGSTGRLATARTIKSWKARAGARPPARPGRARLSSRPIQTPVVSPLEKPMNQPSLFDVVVPVLPAVGPAELGAAAGAVLDHALEQVGHLRRHPGRDQHPRFVVLMLVEQGAVGGGHPADAIRA